MRRAADQPVTRLAASRSSASARAILGWMAETKKCPWRAEEILAAAKKCRHCGEYLESTGPSAPPVSRSAAAGGGSHKCDHCSESFTTDRALYIHTQNTHVSYRGKGTGRSKAVPAKTGRVGRAVRWSALTATAAGPSSRRARRRSVVSAAARPPVQCSRGDSRFSLRGYPARCLSRMHGAPAAA